FASAILWTKSFSNLSRTLSTTTNRLAAMQLCPELTSRPLAQAGSQHDIRVLQDQIGIASAELEYGLLEHRAGLRSDFSPGGSAARQRHGANERILDQGVDLGTAYKEGAKHV